MDTVGIFSFLVMCCLCLTKQNGLFLLFLKTRTTDQIWYKLYDCASGGVVSLFDESLCLLSGTNTRHNDVPGNNSSVVDILLG